MATTKPIEDEEDDRHEAQPLLVVSQERSDAHQQPDVVPTARQPPQQQPTVARELDKQKPTLKASAIIRCLELFLTFVILCLVGTLIGILIDIRQGMLDAASSATMASESYKFTNASTVVIDVKKILYVVSSSSEYNSLRRGMQHHSRDRLMTVIAPVIRESIESMVAAGYEVDLFLLVSYTLTPEREADFRAALPKGLSVEIWNDACPIDYDKKGPQYIMQVSRALSRQHRYVVRDKLFHYDFFCAFEDDMLVTGAHVDHYLDWTRRIETWRLQAPREMPDRAFGYDSKEIWFGTLTKKQLERIRPGFIRVEALLNASMFSTQENIENVPVDMDFTDFGENSQSDVDPSVCCHVKHIGQNGTAAPKDPDPGQLMMWEAGIAGMGVREMPDGTWVGVFSGPKKFLSNPFDYKVGKFHASATHNLRDKPVTSNPKFLAQSAGWMMTRKQLLELHDGICMGSFLPPFDKPTFGSDGLYMNNVEYWSGGLQMWCPRNGCNIQRIIVLEPQHFSKQLLYHTSNNKQKQIKQDRRVRASDLLGQFNHLRKDAIEKKRLLIERGSATLEKEAVDRTKRQNERRKRNQQEQMAQKTNGGKK